MPFSITPFISPSGVGSIWLRLVHIMAFLYDKGIRTVPCKFTLDEVTLNYPNMFNDDNFQPNHH
ncbi:hypothetical protein VSPL_48040 [Vibrio splendidus]|nr:hypothetical protein VSPL_48040 [Vibrio splendidus]